MSKVFRKIDNPEVSLPYDTLTVEVEKTIKVKVKQPLWDMAGKRLSVAELAAIGYEVYVTPEQTPEYYEFKQYRGLYAANPDLENRVKEYKAYFDELGIGYDSNTDVMEVAIKEKIAADVQVEYVQKMQTALTNVKVNYQAAIAAVEMSGVGDLGVTGNDFETWLHTPLLIKYMPSAGMVEPEYKEPYVATEETEAAELAERNATIVTDEPVEVEDTESIPAESDEEL